MEKDQTCHFILGARFHDGEGGAEFFEWQFGKRWIPVVKWVKVGVEVYDTYEEVEKIREKYRHCGW